MAKKADGIDSYRELHADRGGSYDAHLSSSTFDAYMTYWESQIVGNLISKLFSEGVGRYLDFACGTGRITGIIAPHAAEIVGVDVSRSMLNVASEKVMNARFVRVDITSDQSNLGMFDFVSAFRFFGNAEAALRIAALKALNSHLKEGGFLLVNNHRNPLAILSVLDRLGRGSMRADLTHSGFRRQLERGGFRVVRAFPIGVWIFRHRLAARLGSDTRLEARLERLFSSGMWAAVAPDTVILARKVRNTV